MKPILNVHAVPSLVEPEALAGSTVVVVDVLRASTTIVHALAAGAKRVVPCLEVDEAHRIAEELSNDSVLGGERNGLPIAGFDLGNSPGEYLPHRVCGKTIVFTTTNGTKALVHAREAERVVVAGFINAAEVYRQLIGEPRIDVLCAGTRGEISRDDVLLAGLLVVRVERQSGLIYELNAQAVTARENWLHGFGLPQALGAEPLAPEKLAEQLGKSLGGENLLAIDCGDDILAAAQLDQFEAAPYWDPGGARHGQVVL